MAENGKHQRTVRTLPRVLQRLLCHGFIVRIIITRLDGGKLHGDLWWPAALRDSARYLGSTQMPTDSNEGCVSFHSGSVNVERAEQHHGNPHSLVGANPVVVFVHQYSIMGGSSSLMSGMASLVTQRGFPAVTFDLRGVNNSSGWKTLTGHKETQDVVDVCSWCVKNLQAQSIVIVGSSAGAPIGGSAVDQLPEIRGYVGIGYVFGSLASLLFGGHYKKIIQSQKPKLFIHGDGDGFTSTSTFMNYFKSAEEPKEMRVIPNVGHFEMEGPAYDSYMATQIVDFINKYLPREEKIPADTSSAAAIDKQ